MPALGLTAGITPVVAALGELDRFEAGEQRLDLAVREKRLGGRRRAQPSSWPRNVQHRMPRSTRALAREAITADIVRSRQMGSTWIADDLDPNEPAGLAKAVVANEAELRRLAKSWTDPPKSPGRTLSGC